MRCRDRPAWSNPCWLGIADLYLKMALHLEMLFYLISLGKLIRRSKRVKLPWIAMLLWAPLMGLQAPSSFAQSLFDCPPTRVMIHNIESTEGLRNRTTITIVVPEDAGNALGAIVLRQLANLDRWDCGYLEPQAYLGDYSLRGKGTRGLATALVSGPE